MNLNLPINLIILIINYPGHGGTTAAASWSGTSAEIVRHGILKVGLGTATTAAASWSGTSAEIVRGGPRVQIGTSGTPARSRHPCQSSTNLMAFIFRQITLRTTDRRGSLGSLCISNRSWKFIRANRACFLLPRCRHLRQ